MIFARRFIWLILVAWSGYIRMLPPLIQSRSRLFLPSTRCLVVWRLLHPDLRALQPSRPYTMYPGNGSLFWLSDDLFQIRSDLKWVWVCSRLLNDLVEMLDLRPRSSTACCGQWIEFWLCRNSDAWLDILINQDLQSRLCLFKYSRTWPDFTRASVTWSRKYEVELSTFTCRYGPLLFYFSCYWHLGEITLIMVSVGLALYFTE